MMKLIRAGLIKLIRLYQNSLSLLVGRQCRFLPTCSAYAIEAIERYGTIRGIYLTIWRILRCHPLGDAGWDPVPSTFTWKFWKIRAEKSKI